MCISVFARTGYGRLSGRNIESPVRARIEPVKKKKTPWILPCGKAQSPVSHPGQVREAWTVWLAY